MKYTSSIALDTDTKIKELHKEETYLGIEEGDRIQHGKMKEKIRKECYRRISGVLRSELNAKNKLEAINTLAIPAVKYSSHVVNWNVEEIKRTERKIQKLMTLNRMHHSKADVSRMSIPRKGGRGITNLEMAYKATTIGYMLVAVFRRKDVEAALQHEKKKKLHSVVKERWKLSVLR